MPHIYRVFFETVGLGEEIRQSIHGWGNYHNEKRVNIFGKMGNTGDILQGDNTAGYCLVLKVLIPMKFSNKL